MSAILIFLVGFSYWILAGRLEVTLSSYVYIDGDVALAFVTPDKAYELKKGMTVRVADLGIRGTVEQVASEITPYREILERIGETNALIMGINAEDKLVQVVINIKNAPEKVMRVVYILGTIKPISFLLK